MLLEFGDFLLVLREAPQEALTELHCAAPLCTLAVPKFNLPNFSNFFKMSLALNVEIKKGFGKAREGGPGRVREGGW